MLVNFEGDTAHVSGFSTALPATLGNFEIVEEGNHPVIQLDYVEYLANNSGSTEMEVAAYFMFERFCMPLTRVIRKMWHSENGNYDSECKDYQYFSVEFERTVRYRNGQLELGSGSYKFSEKLNCEAVSSHRATPNKRG